MRPSARAQTEPIGLERRAQPRVAGPALTIDLEGHSYRTDNWSLGGFRLCALHRDAVPGERLAGVARDPTGCVAGDVVAEVVWSDRRRVGLQFLELSPRLRRALAAFRQG